MRLLRAALLIAAVAGLLLGMWAGLVRLGWPWPPLAPVLPMLHGPTMACGFLGTLIGVERAVGTGKHWAYLGPALVAFGVLLALLGMPGNAGPLLVTLGSAIVTLVLVGLARLHPANYTVTMAVGGGAWVIGNLLWWLGWPLYVVALWWIGFLVLTIAGERLELSRMLKLTPTVQRGSFMAAALLLCGGIGRAWSTTRRVRWGWGGADRHRSAAWCLLHRPPSAQGGRPGAVHGRGAAFGLCLAGHRRAFLGIPARWPAPTMTRRCTASFSALSSP